jgi:RNA polymerase sigma-70 factor, ECF subfamily
MDDRDLAAQACEGRDQAFRELLARYERPVFALALRMVRDRALAEDLAQEAFIRAFHAIHSYDPSYKFSNWILKIANNLAIDQLRRKKLDTVSIDGSPHAGTALEAERTGITLTSRTETPEEFTEHRELGSRIEAAIGRLRPEYRTAILLRHVEGYPYEEVAEIMGVPLGTAKTYIHRGRAELKTLLSEVVT